MWKFVLTIILVSLSHVGISQQSIIERFGVPTWFSNATAISAANDTYYVGETRDTLPGINRRGLLLVKYDSCQNIQWMKGYALPVIVSPVGLEVAPNGDLILAGTTLEREILLLRLNSEGEIIWQRLLFALLQNYVYAIDVYQDRIALFGAVDANVTIGRRFAMVLNGQGEILWNNTYMNNIDARPGIWDRDGNLLCVNGNHIFKLTGEGDPIWSYQYEVLSAFNNIVSIPLSLPNGDYLIAHRKDSTHHLLWLDPDGEVLQHSQGILGSINPGIPRLLPNGNILWAGSRREASFNNQLIPILAHIGPDGIVEEQAQLQIPGVEELSVIKMEILNQKEGIILTGTQNGGATDDLRIYLKNTERGCGLTPYSQVVDIDLPFNKNTIPLDPKERSFNQRDSFDLLTVDFPLTNIQLCESENPEVIEIDSLMDCVSDFTFESPFPDGDHEWDDGGTEPARILEAPGEHTLIIRTCTDRYAYDFRLDRDSCQCNLFLPNIFTPNFDGFNDKLQILTTCPLLQFDLQVFDRWGSIVFQTNNPDEMWDGTINNRTVPQGVYICRVTYTFEKGPEESEQELFFQDVTIVR